MMPKISVVVYPTMTLFRIGLDFVIVSSFSHLRPNRRGARVARAASRPSDRSNSLRDVHISTDTSAIIPRLISGKSSGETSSQQTYKALVSLTRCFWDKHMLFGETLLYCLFSVQGHATRGDWSDNKVCATRGSIVAVRSN